MAGNKDIGKIILGVLGVGAIATAGIASVVNNDNSKKKRKIQMMLSLDYFMRN